VADCVVSGADAPAWPGVRLAELVAALSLGVDLGFGQPMEHVLHQCLIALRLADRMGLDQEVRSCVYYTALLVNVGCHSDAHEQAKWFGDDIELKSHKYDHEPRSIISAAAAMGLVGVGNPPLHRFRVGLEFLLSGRRDLNGMIERHAELAGALARELGLPDAVQAAVAASYEQWDGRGWPGQLRGDAVPIASRLAQLAEYVEVAHRIGGVDAAVLLASRRGGSQFDPEAARVLCSDPEKILAGLDSVDTWDAVIAAEPSLSVTLQPNRLDAALLGVATFVDLKSPYTLGHARAVSELTAAAGSQLGLGPGDVLTLRRAGLVAGLGKLGVSNAIWDKQGPLGGGEWERVRMHPYLTGRMLRQSRWLAPLGAVAVQLRERLDGSGYPQGLSGGAISRLARILGAADAYQSMCEPRPYRAARQADEAARELRAEVTAGRMDVEAVDVVLSAAGHGRARRWGHQTGLTVREVEVLRLVAQGLSSKQIAGRLVISAKTARNHIEHIYAKIGASSRAEASLYAMQSGLLPELEYLSPRR
jgi:HD-GYP domain-containing protein (c-di-GMP phosphodiesterase class II)